jgi:hypothetical protein
MRAVCSHPTLCHLAALWTAVLWGPRTYSGRRGAAQDGRCNRRFSTDGHGRAALACVSGLTCAVESGVHHSGIGLLSRAVTRGGGGRGSGCADGWAVDPGEPGGGRAGGAGAGRPRVRL